MTGPRPMAGLVLSVPRRDEAAHRVADHDDRQVAARVAHHRAQVVDDRLEVLDQRLLPRRAPVPDVIGPDHRRAAGGQRPGDVLVAADVLAVAVDEHHEAGRVLDGPAADLDAPDRRQVLAHGRESSAARTREGGQPYRREPLRPGQLAALLSTQQQPTKETTWL